MNNFEEATERLLSIPPDFVPYMEKHRLYEFFYELVTQLLIQQPEDPLVFIKQSIQHIVRKRDIPRVILIAPPSFDKMTLAKILQEETDICPVTLENLYALSPAENKCRCYDANEISERMKKMLMSGILHESGWALIGNFACVNCFLTIPLKKVDLELFRKTTTSLGNIPRNKQEARAMQRVGIIPTHVIQIILSAEDNTQEKSILTRWTVLLILSLLLSNPFRSTSIFAKHVHSVNINYNILRVLIASNLSFCESCLSPEDARQYNYRNTLRGLREAYANLLIEIEAGTKTIHELGKDCATLMKIRKHYGAPSLFRIALVGPRGSGRRSLAKHVSDRFNLVHVDFNNILEQACMRETALGEMLRLCEHRCGQEAKSEARVQIIERYVLGSDCLKKGWILTGYPKTVKEFKLLDMIFTPPNRVIVLKIDVQTCKERLLNRGCNDFIIGSEHDLSSCLSSVTDPECKLDVHSNDYKDIVEQDLREYEENIDAIMRYAGETVSVIDATGEKKCATERLEACLMRPAPSAKPRIPHPPFMVDPMDIEFDPDDEPDPSIFDDIRAPEPKYSFI